MKFIVIFLILIVVVLAVVVAVVVVVVVVVVAITMPMTTSIIMINIAAIILGDFFTLLIFFKSFIWKESISVLT